ncbi:DUF4920 domain-containing protein [Roseivirga pacifica]|uniref:DUF4920 domain-containing protein n=1 Tax=Roseivirga pacifica TaxID=1267423 RepID=UPI002095831F|nr:DUF4920 domain-containing protein [Roseivirga pacifica]MCO6358944.1 DUF4920 domain-containing protein [Roseivirga pacifica]MCO6365420.1 DUF4920 domain-containing protein [Roseivirga pacifica]MCO6371850.1 DUF4920 domain-containing protein [Roseivirga pacifica]MCO6376039.1 DUF4920 domain-containing protein [Roseivirga pacifica]MCO6379228.1 DUF4920 domain-containing protein [Roseivirga pacifica]
MRNLLFIAIIATIFSCQQEKSEGTLVGKYGEEITTEGVITPTEMLAKLEQADSVNVKVKGEITATCAMKGCWMNLVMPDGEEMRVTFKDYGFFVPSEGMEGNVAIIDGVLTKTITDVETLRHYAEDAGKPQEEIEQITEDKEELAFVANGVIIYDITEETTE